LRSTPLVGEVEEMALEIAHLGEDAAWTRLLAVVGSASGHRVTSMTWAEASRGCFGTAAAAGVHFDVVVVDAAGAGTSTNEVMRSLRRAQPRAVTVVLLAGMDRTASHEALVVEKPGTADEVQDLLSKMEIMYQARSRPVAKFALEHGFSAAETGVFREALAQRQTKEAAAALGCSERRINYLWHGIFLKTRCHSQGEVLAYFAGTVLELLDSIDAVDSG